MTKHEALTLALEILKAAYVPADLDEQREKAITELEALAQPEQEPVGFAVMERPWVGLTDEELAELSASGLVLWGLWRAIEAKLKEKNFD